LLVESDATFLSATLIGPSAGFTNAGTIRMESSISIGTLVRIPGGALTNTATGLIEGNVTNAGTVAVNGQALEIFSGIRQSVFTQIGGTVRATGERSLFVLERGAFHFNGGTLEGDVVAHNAAVSVAATVIAPEGLTLGLAEGRGGGGSIPCSQRGIRGGTSRPQAGPRYPG
jgi:hypothetical protein